MRRIRIRRNLEVMAIPPSVKAKNRLAKIREKVPLKKKGSYSAVEVVEVAAQSLIAALAETDTRLVSPNAVPAGDPRGLLPNGRTWEGRPHRIRTWAAQIERCTAAGLEDEDLLTPWEKEFLNSVWRQVNNDRELSDGQVVILDRIVRKTAV